MDLFERVAGSAEDAELRRALAPRAVAFVFGLRNEAEMIAFEEARVFLLRNARRKRAGAGGREKIRQ